MNELTKKQRNILDFIQFAQQKGNPVPTLREIAEHFGFKSSRAAADHLDALKRKGFIESDSGKARSLRIISPLAKLRSRLADIPLFGSIPAGSPETREQEAEGLTTVDEKTLGFTPTRNTFALRVKGDSMIGKHICDGDIVVLEFGAEPRNGQVVAAFVDGQSTLKTFLVKNGKPILRAENPKYRDIIPAEGLTIQGVLKGLIRKSDD
jgi:repressor LexA